MFGQRIARLAPRGARLTYALRPGSVAPANPQSLNYVETWSRNQRAKAGALTGPRFEQTVSELQPQPMSAME
ncbi:hypothetical protein BKA62DRAFT_598758, partial [Auriculariales sp. MPI-PUGE-AT-0066]